MLKKALFAVLFLALVAGTLVAEKSTFDPRICPVGPMKFSGAVWFGNRPGYDQDMHMSVRVWKGGVGASGGVMTLMGQRATRDGYRHYCDIHSIAIRRGETITVTFQPPWAGLGLYTATIAAPQLLKITAPANDAHITVGGAGNVDVRWVGGTPPYQLSISKVRGVRVFRQTGIAGTHVSVPLATFAAGVQYYINVEDAKRRFSFDLAVDPATDLTLSQSGASWFYAD